MTTYNGRSAGYNTGKDVVNKEPLVSNFFIERSYKVHRERLLCVNSTLDTHTKVPDFLVKQSWKKTAGRQRMVAIMRTNRAIYDRLATVESSESILSKETKEHLMKTESKMNHLTKIKEHGRLISLVKLQKENEYMLGRIENAKPLISAKKCQEWYKHHIDLKMGRYKHHLSIF
jgi:hypothetical protein